jgi:hypothetical protein
VIATTLRLWMQRHVLLATVLAIIVAGAAVTTVALTSSPYARTARQSTSPPSATDPLASTSHASQAGTSPASVSSAALMAATATRRQAAAWVAAQVSHSVIVACDPLMCSALQLRGFPAADLSVITASASDPLGSGIVMSTTAVRSQLGPRLATVYAPVVIASFGSGGSLIQVRVTAVGGAAAYDSALQADLAARKLAGGELNGNKNIRIPSSARAELAAGRVDSRLLITLAAVAHRFAVKIVSFSDSGPGAGPGVPLRMLTITAPNARYLRQLLAFLRAQRAPLRSLISPHRHGRATTVQIEFTAPSPTGLLSAGTSA